ncbi:MAG: NUDIX domain-containing protein [Candidatus Pacebacteria bacterium]|nr:NUDIX domain-containing protein [Candidatus Paceibacterota bacterium]
MKLIKIIQFKDLKPEDTEKFEIRKAARAVVFDNDKNIGILYVGKYDYHKLPGGGLEGDEGIEEALKRECLEEIGCNIETFGELGEIIEYRDKWLLKQHSYCYLANVVGEKGSLDFTQKEIDNGFEIKWFPLEEAIKLLENDKPEGYEGKFIQIRDSSFLKEANNFFKNK